MQFLSQFSSKLGKIYILKELLILILAAKVSKEMIFIALKYFQRIYDKNLQLSVNNSVTLVL